MTLIDYYFFLSFSVFFFFFIIFHSLSTILPLNSRRIDEDLARVEFRRQAVESYLNWIRRGNRSSGNLWGKVILVRERKRGDDRTVTLKVGRLRQI